MVSLDATGFLQQSFTDAEDYIIKTNSSLSVKLNKWLSLVTNVTYNKLNRTRKENLLLNFGLTVEKYSLKPINNRRPYFDGMAPARLNVHNNYLKKKNLLCPGRTGTK